MTVGIINEDWKQYASYTGSAGVDMRVILDHTKATGWPDFNISNVTVQCREDHVFDENCPNQPSISAMGYYSSFYSRDDIYAAENNGDKRFLNLSYKTYISGYGYEFDIGTFTSWRWKCNFSSPKCQYTGTS